MKRKMRKFGIIILLIFLPWAAANAQRYIDVVVIDAGHGGHDPGAVGLHYKEKDIVLKIALKLGEYIRQNYKDVKVVYTRDSDKFVELHKRSQIANENNADVFISLHCNAVGSPSPYGSETFVMGPHKNDANLEVAKQENASILLEDNYQHQYEGFNPNSPEAHIIFSLYQNTHLQQSAKLAEKVQYQFRERVKRYDRGVKQAGFLVLWRTTMPAILVEAGFLSNVQEEKFLGSEQGQDYIASALFRAFREYKEEMEAISESDEVETTEEDREKEKQSPGKEQEKQENEPNVIFAVQFATSTQKREFRDEEFQKAGEVKRYYQNGLYKYYVGNERSLNDAVLLQHEMQKQGYEDAFVIAFRGGERISISEASKLIAR